MDKANVLCLAKHGSNQREAHKQRANSSIRHKLHKVLVIGVTNTVANPSVSFTKCRELLST